MVVPRFTILGLCRGSAGSQGNGCYSNLSETKPASASVHANSSIPRIRSATNRAPKHGHSPSLRPHNNILKGISDPQKIALTKARLLKYDLPVLVFFFGGFPGLFSPPKKKETRGQELNTNLFSSNFSGTGGISQQMLIFRTREKEGRGLFRH